MKKCSDYPVVRPSFRQEKISKAEQDLKLPWSFTLHVNQNFILYSRPRFPDHTWLIIIFHVSVSLPLHLLSCLGFSWSVHFGEGWGIEFLLFCSVYLASCQVSSCQILGWEGLQYCSSGLPSWSWKTAGWCQKRLKWWSKIYRTSRLQVLLIES